MKARKYVVNPFIGSDPDEEGGMDVALCLETKKAFPAEVSHEEAVLRNTEFVLRTKKLQFPIAA